MTTYAVSFMNFHDYEVTGINGPFDTFDEAMTYAHAWADDVVEGNIDVGRPVTKSHNVEDWDGDGPVRLFSGVVEIHTESQDDQIATINVYPLIRVADDYSMNEDNIR